MKDESNLKEFLSGPLGETYRTIRQKGKLYSVKDCESMDCLNRALFVKASAYIRKTVLETNPEMQTDADIIGLFDSILQTVLHTG